MTAGCIDTDPSALGHPFGQSDGSLTQTVHMHHAMRVTSTETCCEGKPLKENARRKLLLLMGLSMLGVLSVSVVWTEDESASPVPSARQLRPS